VTKQGLTFPSTHNKRSF